MDAVTLTGKTVVVTGANTGIGLETARDLARRGARVVLACRSAERGEQARREIVESTGSESVAVRTLDLASLQSVREFAELYNREESRLDILVNNAGLFTRDRRETVDGFELQFGTNHLGHFYLTYLLLPKLRACAPSRLVVVASEAHEHGKLDLDDLQLTRTYSPLSAYGKSKTANVLFATHIARLLEGTGVTVYSLHPGVIRTELVREYKGNCLVGCFNCFYSCCCGGFLTPQQGAQTTLYCCLEPSLANQSGRYYSDCKEKNAKSYATNPESAERLWTMSAELCKVSPALPAH